MPSNLHHVTINADSNYANGKMAICSELLTRYNEEKAKYGSIAKARIWTTEFGRETSSAPCFYYLTLERVKLPDLFLCNVDEYTNNSERLSAVHHEYTHFLHATFTKNKDYFWDSLVFSEMKTGIIDTFPGFTDMVLHNTDYTRDSLKEELELVGMYDFKNPYVCFAECLAYWYEWVAYSKGVYGSRYDDEYMNGKEVIGDIYLRMYFLILLIRIYYQLMI